MYEEYLEKVREECLIRNRSSRTADTYVLAAVLILIACYVCASITDKALKKNGHEIGALFAKSAIYTLGGFMILNELGVAGTIVNAAFIIVVAAFGVAFAIAFGIGGREFASKMLDKLSGKFDKK